MMKFLFISVSSFVLLVATFFESHSLPLPLGFMLKPYIGVDGLFLDSKITKSDKKEDNLRPSFVAGLRFHRFLGVEVGYSDFGRIMNSPDRAYATSNYYDAMFYLPLLDAGIVAIEPYANVGFGRVRANLGSSQVHNSAHYGFGIQARALGFFGVRVGAERYDIRSSDMPVKHIDSVKIGFQLYFM